MHPTPTGTLFLVIHPAPVPFFVALLLAATTGAAAAWWLHRRTTLAAANVYLTWLLSLAATATVVWNAWWGAAFFAAPVIVGTTTAAVLARRWQRSALGAGGELRTFEQRRVMAWRRTRDPSQRVYIGGQGELVRERAWPEARPGLPMTGDGEARVPLAEGMHLYFVGATGAGKTTSARRWLLARGLGPTQTALLALDPKGDAEPRARPARHRRGSRPAVRALRPVR